MQAEGKANWHPVTNEERLWGDVGGILFGECFAKAIAKADVSEDQFE